jgi:hypothetical protein
MGASRPASRITARRLRGATELLTHKTIAVRATFVGGSAHPAKGGGVSMGIFQGYITSDGSSKFGSFALPG